MNTIRCLPFLSINTDKKANIAMKKMIILAMAGALIGAPASISAKGRPDNRAIITDFARLFYTERKVSQAFETYVAPNYIQHNPGIADGRAAAVAALATMFGDPAKRFTIEQILVDGDMAVIHIHAIPKPGSHGASVFDMYRMKNGKIVEHWDAIQLVPETSANPHPMF